jgi:hypothetical protein
LPAVLIGRDQAVTSVLNRLHNESSKMICVIGPAGIGKTVVASAVAHSIEAEFKLWINGHRPGNEQIPSSFAALLEKIGGDFADAFRPFEKGSLDTQFINLIAKDGRRFLFVMDGLDEIASEREAHSALNFLARVAAASPKAMVLITSRMSPEFHDIRTNYFMLEPLPTFATAELILSRVSLQREQALRIAQRTAGDPLLTSLVANYLRDVSPGDDDSVIDMLLSDFGRLDVWVDFVSHWVDLEGAVARLALEILAIADGRLRLTPKIIDSLESEGIEIPQETFNKLKRSGFVHIAHDEVSLMHAALEDALRARMEPRDKERLIRKFGTGTHDTRRPASR